jgi:hypothetical protein
MPAMGLGTGELWVRGRVGVGHAVARVSLRGGPVECVSKPANARPPPPPPPSPAAAGGYGTNNSVGYGGYPECWVNIAGCGPWAQQATAAYLKIAATGNQFPIRLGTHNTRTQAHARTAQARPHGHSARKVVRGRAHALVHALARASGTRSRA